MKKKVTTYTELTTWIDTFVKGYLDILIVEGNAGIGKSTISKKHLSATERFLIVEGRVSAICLYEKLYHNRDVPVLIDDVDEMYRDKQSVNLLKCLCQTEDEKRISWDTKSMKDMPEVFFTKSKVCILTNRWESLNKHVGAVEDRGCLVRFRPDATEVHKYVQTTGVKVDSQVYEFIGQHLGIVIDPSIRHYRNATLLKAAGMPWQETLIESFGITDDLQVILDLKANGITGNEAAQIYCQKTGKCSRTYWRRIEDLKEKGINFG